MSGRSSFSGSNIRLAPAQREIGVNSCSQAPSSEQTSQPETTDLQFCSDGIELEGCPRSDDEDGLRCLGALVMEVQTLQKRSSNLKEHIHTNERHASIETLESEAQNQVGRVDVLDARLKELDKEIDTLQKRRTDMEKDRQEANELYSTAWRQVELARTRYDQITIANEQLLEVHRQQRERRTKLRID